ncbi:asparagine synthetase B family protein [Clostridium algidicarnis]|uniref:asparagine synthetase B family protein n=1 Tax=Clostridium algidicarnis TaxID=37659 RepID=UPI001C0E0688|nr:asparagine synthetase B family protein [Clostridium algidicarnis]MBU3194437.1 hypothetical protein [Clostridium algidicarnis]
MVKLLLQNRQTYPWHNKNNIWFSGYFIWENRLYKELEAISYFRERAYQGNLPKLLRDINGIFAIVIKNEDGIEFAVDRLRSLPLFYSTEASNIIISDNANEIIKFLGKVTIDKLSLEEFSKSSLFVSGQHTLLKEIKQVQASEYLKISHKNQKIQSQIYFKSEYNISSSDLEDLTKEFDHNYNQIGENLVKALNGRTAVIPLSGGADSRMIASQLYANEYTKVICFTYGNKNSEEARISKLVAKDLNFKWIIVPYTRKGWRQIGNDSEFHEYMNFSGNFTSLPHLQDYLAVKYLKDNELIPFDAVFVPGHSGDLLAGAHITNEYIESKVNKTTFFNTIFSYPGFYKCRKLSGNLKDRISEKFVLKDKVSNEYWASEVEWFNIQERQSKFIVNSVRIYDHFGYEWLLPLWDNANFYFWSKVPLDLKFKRNLYFKVVRNNQTDKLPSTNDINTYKRVASLIRDISILRWPIRKISKITKYYFSSLQMEGIYGFFKYSKSMILNNEYADINDLLCNFYISNLKKYLKKY